MKNKNMIIAIVLYVLAAISLILSIKTIAGGTVDLVYPLLMIVFLIVAIIFTRKSANEKSDTEESKKKIPAVAIVGIALIAFVIIIIVSIILAGNVAGKQCSVDDCKELRVENYEYCVEHKCENCGNEKMKKSDFCKTHTCKTEGCYKEASSGSYCDEHRCLGCPDERVDGKEYCIKHIDCFVDNCTKTKVDGFKYCKEHKCAVSDCTHPITNGNNLKYCGSHGCEYDGCSNLKKDGIYSCSSHKCSTSGCKNAKEKGKSKCSNCSYQAEKDKEYREENAEYLDKLIVDADGKQLYKVYIKDTFKIEADYTGDGNFIIWLLDSNQEEYDLLCNEIGTYKLNTSRNVPDGYYYIKIEWNDGSWEAQWWGTYGE